MGETERIAILQRREKDEFEANHRVLLLVISPFAQPTVAATAYDHDSLLGTIEYGLGLATPHLGSSTRVDDVGK